MHDSHFTFKNFDKINLGQKYELYRNQGVTKPKPKIKIKTASKIESKSN